MEDDISPGSTSSQEEQYRQFDGGNQEEDLENSIVAQRESRISQVFRSWLSYSKLGSPHKPDRNSKPGKYF